MALQEPSDQSHFAHLVNAVMASSAEDLMGSNHEGNLSRKRGADEMSTAGNSVQANQPQEQLIRPRAPNGGTQQHPYAAMESMSGQGTAAASLPNGSKGRRIPCKARGMGDSHTSATAYFDIPYDLKHGAVMSCTHPDCVASGRRFRYCQGKSCRWHSWSTLENQIIISPSTVCEVPVAKRNFQKRHSHGLEPVGDPMLMASVNMNRQHIGDDNGSADGKHRRSVSYDAADTLNQLCGARKAAADAKEAAANAKAASMEKAVSINLTPQEFQWLALLHNRPSVHDHKGMESWMTNIIDVSEKTKNGGTSAPPPRNSAVAAAPTPPTPSNEVLSVTQTALQHTVSLPSSALTSMKSNHLPSPSLPASMDPSITQSQSSAGYSNLSSSFLETERRQNGRVSASLGPTQGFGQLSASFLETERRNAEAERKRNAEEERIRNAEAENLRNMEAERMRNADAERMRNFDAERMSTTESERTRDADDQGTRNTETDRVTDAEAERNMFPPLPRMQQVEMRNTSADVDDTGYDTEKQSNILDHKDDRKPSPGKQIDAPKPQPPTTLADYLNRKKEAAAGDAPIFDDGSTSLQTIESLPSQATHTTFTSFTSSVATKSSIRRRRSVQDARQLMGLIKLNGLKENDFDDIF